MSLIPLEMLLFGRNPPAGMDWATVGLWTAKFRKTAEPCDPPIEVGMPCLTCGALRVTDGRHRVVGALFAGRSHIDAL
jgi:hypothetical protein